MKTTFKTTASVIVGCILLMGGIMYISNWVTGSLGSSKDSHPPCEKLPTVTEATYALEQHEDFAKEIEEIGTGIKVEVGKPCPDDPHRGLILVTYASKNERNAISNFLTQSDGLGVPVYLEKR